MKLDINFKSLENLVRNMGASSVDWVSSVEVTHIETDWKITLETKGLDVGINDIEIQLNGLLQYRGEQILLYIRKEVTGDLPKFHFYDCMTLKTMKKMKKFYRYVVTQRKDGYFLMDTKVSHKEYSKDQLVHLDVCSNCLYLYNKHNNSSKNYTVATFNIIKFFENFAQLPISLLPTNTDTNCKTSYFFNGQENNPHQPSKLIPNISEVYLQPEKESINEQSKHNVFENHSESVQLASIEDAPNIMGLDMNKVSKIKGESERVRDMLVPIFAQESNSLNLINKRFVDEYLWGLSASHSEFIKLLCRRAHWTRVELEEIALKCGIVMLDGALEGINDAAFNNFNAPFTEGDDAIEINQQIVKELIK